MGIEVLHCPQGDEAWHALRRGVPTASHFANILSTSGTADGREKYLFRLAGEIISGETADAFVNRHMERGKEMEDEARHVYSLLKDVDVERVGFIRNDEIVEGGIVGASPDGLIGADGGLEIKTALPDLLIKSIFKGEFPPEHKAQVQGNLLVSNREWWDLAIFYRKCPLFVRRAYRDDAYLKRIEIEVRTFHGHLNETVERVRRLERMGKTSAT